METARKGKGTEGSKGRGREGRRQGNGIAGGEFVSLALRGDDPSTYLVYLLLAYTTVFCIRPLLRYTIHQVHSNRFDCGSVRINRCMVTALSQRASARAAYQHSFHN